MIAYLIRRLLFVVPTLLGIIALNFVIIQAAPGGPVEQMIARLQGEEVRATERFMGSERGEANRTSDSGDQITSKYRGARGLDPQLIKKIEKLYGFDQPAYIRFVTMIRKYLVFDLGESLFRGRSVIELIVSKLPVSISLGVWSTLIIYLISIPMGIRKAVSHGSMFDVWSSTAIIVGYAIPGFLFAVLLIVVFCGGVYLDWFPLRGLVSDNFDTLSWGQKILDYFWHLTLPVTAMVIGGFATLTMLTKNAFLDEIGKQYVVTARAKGLSENRVLYGHVFRNAMLIIIAGFPAAFISMFFAGSLLIETIFSLDGLGLLGFESALNRDYPVMFGTLYIFTLIGLLMKIVSDITYTIVDPRIDFETRE
ncbi:MAG: microcin C ABC transporter permease YejB [Deltaproteobacteria bacterium]|jgi:microcin C transport system permease protein|nr:microcin C ABC transporter permease YejB [Deltaproteobacteria bacterium]